MAPLTWREVSQPDFGSTFKGYANANEALNNGFASIGAALKNFTEARANVADRNILNRALGIQDPEALTKALADGTITGGDARYAHVDTLKSLSDILNNTLRNAQSKEILRENTFKQNTLEDVTARNNIARDSLNTVISKFAAGDQKGANEVLANDPAIRNADPEYVRNAITNGLANTAANIGNKNTQFNYDQTVRAVDVNKQADAVVAAMAKTNRVAQAQAILDQVADPQVRANASAKARSMGGNWATIDSQPTAGMNINVALGSSPSATPAGGAGSGAPAVPIVPGSGAPAVAVAGGTRMPDMGPGGIGGVGTGTGFPTVSANNYNVVYKDPNGKVPVPPKPISTMTGAEWDAYGEQVRKATAGTLKNADGTPMGADVGTSALGAYQIVNSTFRKYAPTVLGANWKEQIITPEAQDKVGQAIFNDAVQAGTVGQTWPSLQKAGIADKVAALPWDDAKNVIAAFESGNGGPTNILASLDARNQRTMANVRATQAATAGFGQAASDELASKLMLIGGDPQDVNSVAVQLKNNPQLAPQLAKTSINALTDILNKGKEYALKNNKDANGKPVPITAAQVAAALALSLTPVTGNKWSNLWMNSIWNHAVNHNQDGIPTTNLNGVMVDPDKFREKLRSVTSAATSEAAVGVEASKLPLQNLQTVTDARNAALQNLMTLKPLADDNPQRYGADFQRAMQVYKQYDNMYDELVKQVQTGSKNTVSDPQEKPNAATVIAKAASATPTAEETRLKYGGFHGR